MGRRSSLTSDTKPSQDWAYSFDDFDHFRDLSHLSYMVVQKVLEHVQCERVHFFIHNLSLREYREEDRENIFSITQDNPLITYLALQNRIIDRKNLRDDPIFREYDVNSFILIDQLGVGTLVPFVYRYQLLGFLGITQQEQQTKLTREERSFLHALQRDLLQNLYAALMIDRRFSELVILSDLGKEISSIKDLPELFDVLFEKISRVFRFDTGVLWLAENEEMSDLPVLGIAASKGLAPEWQTMRLVSGESISGHVYQAGKPLLVKELTRNAFFSQSNREPWLTDALLSIPLRSSDHSIGVLTLHCSGDTTGFTGENLHLISIFANFTAATISNIRLYSKLEKGYIETISALAAALDAKDPYTKGHSERVMHYAVGMATRMGLSKKKIRLIQFAAILHDIGKIGISGDIIRKESGLTDDEYAIIKRHPEIGEQIISAIDFLQDARIFIKYHHERYDGSGYYRMDKTDLPREAMILSIADSFDAMTTDRPYRRALSFEQALSELRSDIGRQFDPESYDALVQFLRETGKISDGFSAG